MGSLTMQIGHLLRGDGREAFDDEECGSESGGDDEGGSGDSGSDNADGVGDGGLSAEALLDRAGVHAVCATVARGHSARVQTYCFPLSTASPSSPSRP